VDYLSQMDSGRPIESFHGDPSMAGLFNFTEDLSQFNFDRKQHGLGEFLQLITDTKRSERSRYCYAGAINVPHHLPDFGPTHPIPLLAQATEQLTSVWLGTETRIPAHWDLPQNLACVAIGRRRFTLFPIDQVDKLYIGPLDITLAGQPSSLVDPYAPDLARFPRFAEAMPHGLCAELGPGDVIYIPSLWLHHVESLDPIGMLVNFWWRATGTGHQFTPMHSLFHAILSLRSLPQKERDAWRTLFDQYIFRPESHDSVSHLPPAKQGVLGQLSETQREKLKKFLASQLLR